MFIKVDILGGNAGTKAQLEKVSEKMGRAMLVMDNSFKGLAENEMRTFRH